MTCRCKTYFCYHCGRELTQKQHYSHFKDGPFGKVCWLDKKDPKGHIAGNPLGPKIAN